MHTRFEEDDAVRALIERRWFALHRAAGQLQEECESLAEVLQATRDAWQDARSRLLQIEAMRDALGEELAQSDSCRPARATMGSAA